MNKSYMYANGNIHTVDVKASSKFQDDVYKLKKKLFQWRINSLNHSVTTKQTQSNTKVVKNSGSSVFDKLYMDARNKNNMNKKSNLSANNN